MIPNRMPPAEPRDTLHGPSLTSYLPLQADLERARGEYALDRLDSAAKILEELIAKLRASMHGTSQSVSIHHALLLASAKCVQGRVLRRRGDEEAARVAFKESSVLFDEYAGEIGNQQSRSRLYTDYGMALYRLGRLREAIDLLREADLTGAAPVEAFGYLGLAYRDTNDLEESIRALRKGLQLSPGDQNISAALAEALGRRGNKEEALPAYCEAARIALQKGDMKEGERLLSLALELDRTYPDALNMRVILARLRRDEVFAMAMVDSTLAVDPNHSWALGLKAAMLNEAGDRAAAVDLYQRIKITSPDLSWVLVQWAEALHLGDPPRDAEALALLNRATELNSEDHDALVVKAAILENSDIGKAEAILQRAAQEHPHSFGVQLALARISLRTGNHAVASKALDAVLLFDRKYVPALITKADLLEKENRFDEALEILQRAARLQPEDPGILPRVVHVLYALGRIDEALKELDSAIAQNPEHWAAYSFQGQILSDLDRLPDALQSFENAVRIRPADADLQVELGEVLRRLDRYDEADRVFGDAMKLALDSPKAILFTAFYLCDTAAFTEAISLLQRGSKLEPKNEWISYLLGWAWQHVGRDDATNAERAYRRAIELNPRSLAARKGLANVLHAMDRRDEAKEIFTAVINEQMSSSGNGAGVNEIQTLGWCYYRLHQYDEAVRLFKSCLSIDPANVAVHFDLALALLADGRSSAHSAYQSAIEDALLKQPLRQRGLFYIALYDLTTDMIDVRTNGSDDRMLGNAWPIFTTLRDRLGRSGVDVTKVPWLNDNRL